MPCECTTKKSKIRSKSAGTSRQNPDDPSVTQSKFLHLPTSFKFEWNKFYKTEFDTKIIKTCVCRDVTPHRKKLRAGGELSQTNILPTQDVFIYRSDKAPKPKKRKKKTSKPDEKKGCSPFKKHTEPDKLEKKRSKEIIGSKKSELKELKHSLKKAKKKRKEAKTQEEKENADKEIVKIEHAIVDKKSEIKLVKSVKSVDFMDPPEQPPKSKKSNESLSHKSKKSSSAESIKKSHKNTILHDTKSMKAFFNLNTIKGCSCSQECKCLCSKFSFFETPSDASCKISRLVLKLSKTDCACSQVVGFVQIPDHQDVFARVIQKGSIDTQSDQQTQTSNDSVEKINVGFLQIPEHQTVFARIIQKGSIDSQSHRETQTTIDSDETIDTVEEPRKSDLLTGEDLITGKSVMLKKSKIPIRTKTSPLSKTMPQDDVVSIMTNDKFKEGYSPEGSDTEGVTSEMLRVTKRRSKAMLRVRLIKNVKLGNRM